MELPAELLLAIQEVTAGLSRSELRRATAELTAAYRSHRRLRPQLDPIHQAAYLLTRLPATYAVLLRILRECRLRLPDLRVETMLDLGAGPGTALWAAAVDFPELARVVLAEDNGGWIELGKRLTSHSHRQVIHSAEWKQGSIAAQLPNGKFDLVTVSYVLKELPAAERIPVIEAAWERTAKLLLIAEPGTPAGFQHIREVRRQLIATKAHLVAPCPHQNACPMQGDDWCHFAERLERTSEHRRAKGAELGYEDEKYSYLVFSREPVPLPAARILRHPRKHSGHVELELCTPPGLRRETISRKDGEKYKAAKKAEWGDVF
jgi:ribosomal protein RSM22 (predicted rRNA methylase)